MSRRGSRDGRRSLADHVGDDADERRRGDREARSQRDDRSAADRLSERRARRDAEAEADYGADTRRLADQLRHRGSTGGNWVPSGPHGATRHDPIVGWYEPDPPSGEVPRVDDVFGTPPGPPPGYGVAVAPAETPADRRDEPEAAERVPSSQRASMLVAAGILLSRMSGLIREAVIFRYLGTSIAADAFKAALRIPNLMQNLLGEGVLSASFIPVYARLRAEGDDQTARRVAGSVAGLLIALAGGLSLIGVLFAGPITRVVVPGYTGERFELTVQLVRIMFPGIGFLVLSAWCLGVLNSHRKFFLSYVAPVVWNVAQIAALVTVVLAGVDQRDMAVALAWGVFIGGVLQCAVQFPSVLRALGGLRLSLSTSHPAIRSVLSRFGPVVMGRGVVQIMGYVDLMLASFLVGGAVSSLTYAQVLYLLPISVFGMSVAAAELPDLSAVEVTDPAARQRFRQRLEAGMARILFYVAPTTTLFIVAGDVIVRALFQQDSAGYDTSIAIWFVIATFSLGLPATATSRLLQNALYALDDARTPARLAALRVVVAAVIGLALMFPLDRLFIVGGTIHGWDDLLNLGPLPKAVRQNPLQIPHLGIVGLSIGAAISSWIEYRLLSSAVAWRIGRSRMGGRWMNPIATACIATALVAFGAELLVGDLRPLVAAVLVLGPAGIAYLVVTQIMKVPEADALIGRIVRLARRR